MNMECSCRESLADLKNRASQVAAIVFGMLLVVVVSNGKVTNVIGEFESEVIFHTSFFLIVEFLFGAILLKSLFEFNASKGISGKVLDFLTGLFISIYISILFNNNIEDYFCSITMFLLISFIFCLLPILVGLINTRDSSLPAMLASGILFILMVAYAIYYFICMEIV
ncbi:hypothetical protein [Cobetia amphilecti]|uniref:hypothetical protein n=1 Tax=Cobetia amphilecti TaxID=1055104 RepID=UPI00329A58C8